MTLIINMYNCSVNTAFIVLSDSCKTNFVIVVTVINNSFSNCYFSELLNCWSLLSDIEQVTWWKQKTFAWVRRVPEKGIQHEVGSAWIWGSQQVREGPERTQETQFWKRVWSDPLLPSSMVLWGTVVNMLNM